MIGCRLIESGAGISAINSPRHGLSLARGLLSCPVEDQGTLFLRAGAWSFNHVMAAQPLSRCSGGNRIRVGSGARVHEHRTRGVSDQRRGVDRLGRGPDHPF